jgi:hypothetical protein
MSADENELFRLLSCNLRMREYHAAALNHSRRVRAESTKVKTVSTMSQAQLLSRCTRVPQTLGSIQLTIPLSTLIPFGF